MIEPAQIGANGYPEWEQDPDDDTDYNFNWSEWLAKRGLANLLTSTWIVPSPLVKVSESNTSSVATVTIDASAAVRGRRYLVTNRITAAGARKKDLSLEIVIRQE